MKQDQMEKFSTSGSKTSGIPLKNPESVGKRRGSMRCGLTARNIRGDEGAERGVTNWQKEDRMFVSEGGMGAPHWQREAKLNSGGIRSGAQKTKRSQF